MTQNSSLQTDITQQDERLAKFYYSNRRYNPVLLTVVGLGFISIYLLTRFGILGGLAPQLLLMGGFTLLYALAEVPLLNLAQQGKGIVANFYATIVAAFFAILVTFVWKGMILFTIPVAAVTPILSMRNGMPRKYVPAFFWVLAAAIGGILLVEAKSPFERLQNSNSAALASIVFLLATAFLLLTITTVSQNGKFHSLQGLLLTSFVIIVTIPTVMTAVLSAVGAYAYNQTQTFDTLEAITTLKINQVETLLASARSDTKTLLEDASFSSNALGVLTARADLNPILVQNYRQVARTRAANVLGAEEEAYSEIMVTDAHGTVVISTIPSREGNSFQKQTFFQLGLVSFYAGFVDERSFGAENLVIATPIFDSNRRDIRGVLVLRSNATAMKAIMENTPGFVEAETYFVDSQFAPVTRTHTPVNIVSSKAAIDTLRKNIVSGQAVYANYAGQQVLGYYRWFRPMQLAVIAEVPVNFVVNSSINSLAGSAVLALLVVAVAIIAVIVSARAIADPIGKLAQTTSILAAGELSTRAAVDREDEIGTLAKAYNQMAAQLQEMVNRLEQRVADRTKELEGQTLRLRVAAEIARDAASTRGLQELLDQTAELICNRFGFYHTGIFLLDNQQEYAVLVASPTEAGKQMMESNHKLRVGEIGIVGRVAATGEPRVTLNTGIDTVYFNNPYLVNTQSEMALPLKLKNSVIGVLDVQSDNPQAFTEEDVAVMQVLADQLATAIERARLLQEVERNLKELESAYGRFTSDNWKGMEMNGLTSTRGYHFDNVRIEPVTELPEGADVALKTGRLISPNGSSPQIDQERNVAVPIKLRGQTIGVVSLKLKEGYDRNTIAVVESAAERLAAAMESARLYEEARLRADREQSISRVTSAISASMEYEQILQTTVREIGEILRDTEVAIQILEEPASDQSATMQSER